MGDAIASPHLLRFNEKGDISVAYKVIFNCGAAIAKMPKRRRSREKQFMDDYTKAIHRRAYECEDQEALRKRMEYILGHTNQRGETEDLVTVSHPSYGEKTLPVRLPGVPQGYYPWERIVFSMDCSQKPFVFLPFKQFYDMRQGVSFSGCYIEIYKCD